MQIKLTTLKTTLAFLSCSLLHAEEIAQDTNQKKHITLIAGTHHYAPNKSLPQLKIELERLGFEVSLINPAWNPEKDSRGLPGLKVLEDSDLAVFFIRWLKLEGEQYKYMMDYVKAGKPVVGLRTSNHGFKYPEGHKDVALNTDFGKDVLGSPYLIHLKGSTTLKMIESEKDHPILTGITGTWVSPGTLYLSKLEEGAKPLIQGTGKSTRVGTVTNDFGTHELKAEMTDNIAWTWENKYGGKTFYTSLGHVGDFSEPMSMRVIVNGIHWAAGVSVPSAQTEIKTLKINSRTKHKSKK